MNRDERTADPRNVLLRIAYDGTDFCGWQIQPGRATVQGTLTDVFSNICTEAVHLCGSGRTDAGVHACEQAANVLLRTPIPLANLVRVLNQHLPDAIRVLSAQEAPLSFHARRDARSKIYRYRIYRREICPPRLSRFVFSFPYPLDEPSMQEAAKHFEGTRDFRSVASSDHSEDEERSYVRTLFSSRLERLEDELVYTVEGSGFLHHMVRNIVGTLVMVGRGKIPPSGVPSILAARSRSSAGPTMPGRGLHLVRVFYPEEVLRLRSGSAGAAS